MIDAKLASDLPQVKASASELEQVVLNLLINAAQAMTSGTHGGSQITLRTLHVDNAVELSVADQGTGTTADCCYLSRSGIPNPERSG